MPRNSVAVQRVTAVAVVVAICCIAGSDAVVRDHEPREGPYVLEPEYDGPWRFLRSSPVPWSPFASDQSSRDWSTRYDGRDTRKALNEYLSIDATTVPLTLARALESRRFAVIFATASNYRKAGGKYDGSEEMYLAWAALKDSLPLVPESELLIADVDVSSPDARRQLELDVLGAKVAAVPRLYVLARFPNITRGRLNYLADAVPVQGANVPKEEWVALGFERMGDRTYSHVAFALDATFSPSPVRTVCTEADLRRLMSLWNGANYALVVVWETARDVVPDDQLLDIALGHGVMDLIVARLDDADTCQVSNGEAATAAEQQETGANSPHPADLSIRPHYLRADAPSRAALLDTYNPWGASVSLLLSRPWADPAVGFVSYHYDFTAGGETSEERFASLRRWVGSARRAGYLPSAIDSVIGGSFKVQLHPSGASCALADKPKPGDTVMVEMVSMSASSLIEFSHWAQRRIRIGVIDETSDLPLHVHALLMEACVGVSATVALSAPAIDVYLHDEANPAYPSPLAARRKGKGAGSSSSDSAVATAVIHMLSVVAIDSSTRSPTHPVALNHRGPQIDIAREAKAQLLDDAATVLRMEDALAATVVGRFASKGSQH
jgi:hypothetical protein